MPASFPRPRFRPAGADTPSARQGSTDRRARRTGIALAMAVVASLVTVVGTTSPASAGPPPVMTGYIPLPADDMQRGMESVRSSADTTIDFTVGITNAAAGSIMYYDQWEDGYEATINVPSQSSTLIFGDGNTGNGNAASYCGVCAGDTLPQGASLIMRNNIATPRGTSPTRFDGGDKIASTHGFAITAGGFTVPLGSVLAGVVASYDTSKYSTAYTVPVGEDTPVPSGTSDAFSYTGVVVQASQDSTLVEVDRDADGTVDVSGTINEGKTFMVDGGVNEGATIRSSKPVQVQLVTGDTVPDWESRWYTIFPDSVLSNDYMSMAGSSNGDFRTVNYLYNPSDSDITVTPTCTGCSGTFTVPANASADYTSPLGQAVRFVGTGPFIALAGVGAQSGAAPDSGSDRSHWWDWGFTMVPTSQLTTQVVLGWAPGNSNNPPSSPSGNRDDDPVWVTTLSATTVRVDLDGDPSTGSINSPDCFGARHDRNISVSALASTRIFDNVDGDMTGARIYTCDGTKVSGAWGQDPSRAAVGSPGFDAGYTIIPTTTMIVDKGAGLTTDTNGDGAFGPGDTITYDITISDAGSLAFTSVNAQDALPAGITYVPGSTVVDDGATVTPIADDVVPPAGTPFPLDESGASLPNLAAGQTVNLSYRATIDDPFLAGDTSVSNSVCVAASEASACDSVTIDLAAIDVSLTKTETASPSFIGDDAVFRLTAANGGPDSASDVEVTDVLPAGTTFVSASASQGAYDDSTGIWQVGTLTSGDSETLDITATIDVTSVENFAEITSPQFGDPDSQPAENPLDGSNPPDQDDEDSVVVTVTTPSADLSLDKSVTDAPAFVGDDVTFDIEVTNDGPNAAPGVTVEDVLPSGLTFVSSSATQGSYDETSAIWTVGTMANGASETLTITATLTVPGPVTNSAEINAAGSDDPDSTPDNNVPAEDDQDSVDVSAPGASIGDRVWADLDGDGTQDPGETGLNGVTVTLLEDTDGDGTYDTTIGTTVTAGDGDYSFDGLPPGDYRVDIDETTLPLPMLETTSEPQDVTLAGAETVDTADFGYVAPASLGDRIWVDLNADGVQDGTETGLNGVTVTLLRDVDGDGTYETTVDTQVTAGDGDYSFTGLLPGDYQVDVDETSLPAGSLPTSGNEPFDQTLTAGQTVDTADFGYVAPASLGDRIWVDLNADGVQDGTETGLNGVTVTLLRDVDGDGTYETTVDTQVTAGDGDYSFTGLLPGDYQVDVDETSLPAGSLPTSGNEPFDQTLVAGQIVDTADFGYVAPASLGDRIWVDTNADGVQDGTETGLNGVTVTLLQDVDGDGTYETTVTSTVTAGDGDYTFTGLLPGDYQVDVDETSLPAGSLPTSGNEPFDQTLTAGQAVDTADFGYVAPASLGDRIWVDLNADGVQDGTETGLNGVTVTLLQDVDGDGTYETTVTSTVTAGDGDYTFTGLLPGDYQVDVDETSLPAGSLPTSGNEPFDQTLVAGQAVDTADFGYVAPASLGDRIWVDLNADGSQDPGETGLNGVTVTLLQDVDGDGTYETTVTSTVTAGDGDYTFTGLLPGDYQVDVDETSLPAGSLPTSGNEPFDQTLVAGQAVDTADFGYVAPASLGDRIWVDLNADGVQDGTETGLNGVTVTLLQDVDGDGTYETTVTTTVTAGDGDYTFTGLVPGDYRVDVDQSTLPSGSLPTTANEPFDQTLTAGQTVDTADFGYVAPASLGDRIWVDLNADGSQDPGESGMNGITVTLLRDIDGDGTYETTVTSTVTAGDGDYTFTNLFPGDYRVDIDETSLPSPGLLETTSEPQDQTLIAGQVVDTADFGYVAPASIGDRIWVDTNADGVQDATETGLNGITVTLLQDVDGDGTYETTVTSTVTAGDGDYDFTGLLPGDYRVNVDEASLPAGSILTTGNEPFTQTLTAGQAVDTADFGYVAPASIGDRIWVDTNADGVQDGTETGLNGVTVTLLEDTDGDGTYETTVDTQVTTGDGDYDFTGLLPGDYRIDVDETSLPAGSILTTGNEPFTQTLTAGQAVDTADFGYVTPASLGDRIWVDTNADGVQDGTESGLNGITVTLLRDVDGDGIYETTVDTAVTSGDGDYDFTGLTPGDYRVDVDESSLPAGSLPTSGNEPFDQTLTAGQAVDTADFGYLVGASIGDRVWADLNGNGSQDPGETGLNGVTVTLLRDIDGDGTYETTVDTAVTAGDGNYNFTNLFPGDYRVDIDESTLPLPMLETTSEPQDVTVAAAETVDTADFGYVAPASIGDRVWDDTNGNGSQDPGETGMNGITVTLLRDIDGDGTYETTVDTQVTSGDGNYNFTGLLPGAYRVDIDEATLPAAGLLETTSEPQDQTLVAGQVVDTADFGYVAPASIGDRVWDDSNGNGVQDGTETGLNGVTVTLLEDTDGDGTYETTVTTTVTAGDGDYTFTSLVPGDYRVDVDGSSIPGGYVITTGNEPFDQALTDGQDVDTADFGYRVQADLSLTKTEAASPTYVGDGATFQIVVTNDGPADATGVEVTDVLPAGLTYVSDLASEGTYDEAGGVWSGISLASGESATLNLLATVDTPGTLTNGAEVTAADQFDPDSTPDNDEPAEDDQDTAEVSVQPLADLSLVKTHTGTPAFVGNNTTFTITVTNDGPSTATGVGVTDQLPAGLAFVNATASQGTYDAPSGVWTVGDIADGASATLTLEVTVNTPAADNLAEITTVNEDDPDSQPAENPLDGSNPPDQDDEDNAVVRVDALIDLSVSKTATTIPTYVGQNASFDIVVANAGPSPATGVVVTDELPTGLDFVSASATQGGFDDGSGLWSVGDLAVGGSATLTITATVETLSVTNLAQVSAVNESDVDSTPGNDDPAEDDQDDAPVTVAPLVDLSLDKALTTVPTYLGDTADFTVTVSNEGPSDATGVVVTDRLPAGLTYVGDDSGGDYDATAGTWDVGGVPAGGSVALTVEVTVDTLSAANFAEVTSVNEDDPDSQPAENPLGGTNPPDQDDEDRQDVTVDPLADLSLTKTSNPATVNQLDQATFTLTLNNDGPSPATGVEVDDLLPTGVTYLSDTPSQGFYLETTGVWNVGTLPVAGTATLDIVVRVDDAGLITNTAQVGAVNEDDPDSTPDNDDPAEDDQDSAPLSSEPVVDLSLTKSTPAAEVHVGSETTYLLTLTNDGPSGATGVTVTDALPSAVSHVSNDPSQGSYDPGTGIWNAGDLARSATATLEITVEVDAPGDITNVAEVSATDQLDVDSQPLENPLGPSNPPDQDDEADADLTGVQIDLELTKTADAAEVNVGDDVTYTLTVVNQGPSEGTGIAAADLLPTGVTFVGATSSQGAYNALSGAWDIGSLAATESATLEIVATVSEAGPIVNGAQVTAADQPDADSTPDNDVPGEDDQDDVTVVGLLADLSLVKTVDEATPDLAAEVTYTLTLTNDGPSTATGVRVDDQLPVGLTHVSDTSGGTYDPSTGSWVVGTLASGSSTSIDITVTAEVSGNIVNTARVQTSDQPDPDSTPGNTDPGEDDESSVTISPQPASVEGSIWLDTDGDGTRSGSEPPIPGVTVVIYDEAGNPVASTVTDDQGAYRFTELEPGTYRIQVDSSTLPDEVAGQTYDVDDVFDNAHTVVLVAGQNTADIDFAYEPVPSPAAPTPPTATQTPAAPTTPPSTVGRLSYTGGTAGTLALGGVLLMVAGLGLALAARRRRS